MATVTQVPAVERPVLKPTRSMTYPLRDPMGNTAKRRAKPGEPFDAEDLSRRLTAHLAEQKIKVERRREARASKVTESNGGYHHVPKVAASAFERTATPVGNTRQMHKLSQPILKAHLEHPREKHIPGHPSIKLKETQAMDQAMIERELLRNRNPFQWTHDMEEALEVDVGRDLYKPPQRTFNIPEFAHLRGTKVSNALRPLSMGDVFSDKEVPIAPRARQKSAFEASDRNDWAQRDEESEIGRQKREWAGAFLRKKDSIWILGSRKEKSNRQDKEAVAGTRDFGSPPVKKGRFLARFKRHPS
ncbi:hypothetical protein LHYA1_G000128 [Lachnellula hyalina]|uniref:Uncharacterized protein n=1 Tax=Lachnellula hyalina TaxID=1316788 RepID=A0A8H8RA21_9HELO|nr:uncharacterized protein LHYA1_G000128 [Lachnellula hyalina]TVY31176.1 hypothetical protein LHYA1_G000128 [Lachnellula hyalina]